MPSLKYWPLTIGMFTVLWCNAALSPSLANSEPSFTQYFANLPFRETPFSPLVGTHAITEKEAKTRKHFRFEYDAQRRPIRVAFMQGEKVVGLNDNANYYFFAPKLEISYDENTETRVFFDKHDNRIAVTGDVFREVYQLDERGYRHSLEFFNHHGDPVENSWGVARYEWTLLDDGEVIEKRFNFKNELQELRSGFPFYEVRFHYGPDGWLALMQNYGHEGRLTLNDLNAAQDRLDYAANGDLLSWNVLDENGKPSRGNGPGVARGILERNEYGYDVVERYENEHGEPIKNAYGWSYSYSTYDRFGNYVDRTNYALDRKTLLKVDNRGYAGYAYTYDRHGRNRLLITFFDENRLPARREGRGYYAIRSVYDNNDNEIETRFETANGKLINREDTGFAIVKRTFDSRGRLLQRSYHDTAGEIVNHRVTGIAIEEYVYGDYGIALSTTRYASDGAKLE
ncbi:MAG: hypothetical protein AAF936_03005 [Pseudomonadota bacterium]